MAVLPDDTGTTAVAGQWQAAAPLHVALTGALTLSVLPPIGAHYARFAKFFARGLPAASPTDKTRARIDRTPEWVVITAYIATTSFFVFDQNFYHFSGT